MRRFLLSTILSLTVALVLFSLLIVRATQERSVFDNGHLIKDVWFQVTLVDAYLGFGLFYLWVIYKEKSPATRLLWFVLIMCLGNVATILFLLIQFVRLPEHSPLSHILFVAEDLPTHRVTETHSTPN